MAQPLDRLLQAFCQVPKGPPVELIQFLRELPKPEQMPSPWDSWALIGLVRHRRRLLWVHEIARDRLQADPPPPETDDQVHPHNEFEQRKKVPGLPDWEYAFDGPDCCLTNLVSGEVIDLVFLEDSAEYFFPYYYRRYLDSLRAPEPVEIRLKELFPDAGILGIALNDLVDLKALIPFSGKKEEFGPTRVSEQVRGWQSSIEAFCRSWSEPDQRVWLAGLIGDWPLVHALAKQIPEIQAIARGPKERAINIRRDRLLKIQGRYAEGALYGLAELGLAKSLLVKTLRGAPNSLSLAALKIVANQKDEDWCSQVHALFLRVRRKTHYPENWIRIACLKYLLERGYRRAEMVKGLEVVSDSDIAEAALLALEHAPEVALPLIRKSLRSPYSQNGLTMAVALALIDRPWSKRELLRVLDESSDRHGTLEIRAAIQEMGDVQLDDALRAWEERTPRDPPKKPEGAGDATGTDAPETGGDELAHYYDWVRDTMDRLHDRVMRVWDVEPPEPEVPQPRAPWWQVWNR